MKNNYDLILNFETNDGEPLSEELAEHLLYHAEYVARILASYHGITVWKAIISQAVSSKKIAVYTKG